MAEPKWQIKSNGLNFIVFDPGDDFRTVAECRRREDAEAICASREQCSELLRFKERLEWLHTGGEKDAEGYEWGVARLKFNEHGQLVNALWTNSDHGDLDAEIARTKRVANKEVC